MMGAKFCSPRYSVRGSRRRSRLNAGNLRQRRVMDRIALFPPGVEPALQRSNLLDALLAQQDRELGARRLVGARTVENDLPVARQLVVFFAQLLRIDAKCAGNRLGIGFEVERV